MLPGPILLIDREAVASEPEEQISGWMVRAEEAETLPRLVLDAGIIPDLRYVFTGQFDDAALARAAESAATVPAPSALLGEVRHDRVRTGRRFGASARTANPPEPCALVISALHRAHEAG